MFIYIYIYIYRVYIYIFIASFIYKAMNIVPDTQQAFHM